MAVRLHGIFFLALHLFVSGVLSGSIFTIQNKCDQTIWPVTYTWASQVSETGLVLRRGEELSLQAPSSWYGIIFARTLCSTNSTGDFSCVTGDCGSGKIECPGRYGWSEATYIFFRINYSGINSYFISLEYGYNLPVMVVPSHSSPTCFSSGCMVDLNKTCPNNLKILDGIKPIACFSACRKSGSHEDCCTRYFSSRQNCKKTVYSQNFERACPLAYTYPYSDDYTFICPNSTNYIITFCPSSIPNTTRSSVPLAGGEDNSLRRLKLVIGGSSALAMLIIIIAVGVMVRVKNARRKSDSNYENIEAVVMLKRYSYENVKKMTNSFSHVLGKGGFGTVYKGKLPDASGRDIALKFLKDPKGDGEDFTNELASMSIASHVNIVSLFGFCYEGSKRAIIYEFMPNGSLDKFISEDLSTKMDWKTLFDIAVGIAHGLDYLHNSCVSKIVHFDIKPQNILMDENFCPKISDFGLAKLCKNDGIISMFEARGTIGYIAPEIFSKSYGSASHKSDVYSYGMVVLELIGATSRERAETCRSNIGTMYFPDWIYEDLERNETKKFFGDQIIEDEEMIVRKMKLVGLWCIQTDPSHRPPMKKVVEMLEGSVEDLVVPPKPLLTPGTMAWEPAEESAESEETSSLLTPSQLERF